MNPCQEGGVTEGHLIDEYGMLTRHGGGFALARDAGGVWELELARVPVDLVGRHVRVIGIRMEDDRIDVEGVQPGRAPDARHPAGANRATSW